jgi:hypothetical protein
MSESDRVAVRDAVTARERRREALARIIWADRGGLVGDALGETLPERLWRQALPRADAILTLAGARSVEPPEG